MNWNDLRIFLAIARTGSLTGAAEQLGVNQSTVSRRLATMEKRLETRLFNRHVGEHGLTAAGEELLEIADKIDENFTQIEGRVTGRDTRIKGRLRVTCTDNFANRYLAPHFVRFTRMNPEINLDIITTYESLSLARREADVAIRTTPKPPETLVGRRLLNFALGVYGAPELVAELPENPDPSELTWVGWENEVYNRQMVSNHYPTAKIRHRFDSLIDMTTMTRAGLGVAVLGCFSADPDPALQRVYPQLITDASMDLWVLSHPELLRVARVREFTNFIADTILADRDLFEGRKPTY